MSTNDLSPDHERMRRRADRRGLGLADAIGHARKDRTSAPRRSGKSGKQLYGKYCAQCHGDKGDGEGYATPHLYPRPRNFTTGKFKVRTTPNGALPTHQDLVNIIRRGMPYTSMPAWPNLTDQEVANLAYYITTFSPDFTNPERAAKPVELPSAPAATSTTIEQGKKLYEETGCAKCHGTLGRGDGPSAPTLKDDCDHPIRAADLTQSWTFRGGATREDIFRTMSTGFNGTPMPAFVDGLSAEQRWAITDYIASLSGGDGPGYTNLVVAKYVKEPIDIAKGAASFAAAPVARLPIVGQIMEPGRAFHPPATSLSVQAIYDDTSMATLVRWHDRTAEKTGQNGPSLPVPPEEEEEGAAGAAEAAGGEPVRRRGGGARSRPAGRKGPLCRSRGAGRDVRVLRRDRDPDSRRRHRRRRASRTSSSATRRTRSTCGSSIWPRRPRCSSPARAARTSTPKDPTDVTGVASYDQGEWSVIFKRRFARARLRRSRRESSCPSPSRCGTGSRASAATGAVSRSGIRSTSNPRTSRRPSVR